MLDLYLLALGPSAVALSAVAAVALYARTRPPVDAPTLYLIFSASHSVKESEASNDKSLR